MDRDGAAGGVPAAARGAASGEGEAVPSLPSLAVLPFQNLSGDPEQDYLADGVVEDIITALSRFKSFAVVARNSSFAYRGRAVDVRTAAMRWAFATYSRAACGVRVRVCASRRSSIEGASGAHIWANSYDGAIDDVFDHAGSHHRAGRRDRPSQDRARGNRALDAGSDRSGLTRTTFTCKARSSTPPGI